MVGMGCDLSAMGVGVSVRHVGGHVAMVLVIMSTCPAPFLVHVRVVSVGWWHRVEMVRAVVCGGSLTRACGAIGRRHAKLVQTTQHVCLHLEGHRRSTAVLVHQLHGCGIVIHVVRHRRGVLRVQLHVGQGRDAWGRWGLKGVTRGRWRRQVRGVGRNRRGHGGAKVLCRVRDGWG